ncbi:hypothetical protein VCRA2112E186_160047 [Vibrio crassostreae]|nr:hypothetical protein VCRA2119O245_140047 [Vibrio crassostreae]CAK1783214.1 hypothetical protein VCRA2112E186_160047 [Vibrio crassostreae]CAK1785125.1 hypothetical protein VCRA2113O196_150086 [Vibrio crassostreae]CAK1826477.1 hypothetical protein VCRA2113O221_190055 [Vibrio crassostreae]CAK2379482.1 hypothetical protein VCRA2113O217_60087 [Vibrio crassostreae]
MESVLSNTEVPVRPEVVWSVVHQDKSESSVSPDDPRILNKAADPTM